MNEINYRSAPQSPISVQTLRGSTIVVGDVHGDLNQLMFPLLQFLKNTDKYKKLIFLGDYIDRGESNLYVYGVIKFIMSLDEYKNRIFFLRGNHECYATAVYDMFDSEDKDGDLNEEKFMTTFVYNSIHVLDFDIIHYDSELGIVYSHSPLSRPLKEVLHMNDTKNDDNANNKNTFTKDEKHDKMEYKNIHGHIHYLSNSGVLEGFFKGNVKMLSLDGDSSYGIELVSNFILNKKSKKKLISRVKYLIISDDGVGYRLVEHDIDFYDRTLNYNLLRFEQLKMVLKRSNPYVAKNIANLRFSDLLNVFVSEFYKSFGIQPSKDNLVTKLKDNYTKCVKKAKGASVYFNDLPVDVAMLFGVGRNERMNEVGKLFFVDVLGKQQSWEDNYKVGFKRQLTDETANVVSKNRNIDKLNENINERFGNNGMMRGGNNNNNAYYMLRLFITIASSITIIVLVSAFAANVYFRWLHRRAAMRYLKSR